VAGTDEAIPAPAVCIFGPLDASKPIESAHLADQATRNCTPPRHHERIRADSHPTTEPFAAPPRAKSTFHAGRRRRTGTAALSLRRRASRAGRCAFFGGLLRPVCTFGRLDGTEPTESAPPRVGAVTGTARRRPPPPYRSDSDLGVRPRKDVATFRGPAPRPSVGRPRAGCRTQDPPGRQRTVDACSRISASASRRRWR
jgi:hypothetical protein